MRSVLTVLCVILAVVAAVSPVTPSAATTVSPTSPAAYDCEGNACAVLTLTWEEEGQRFRADNSSDRRVKVEVTTFAGASRISVEPHKSEYLQVKNFNGPYRADYE